MARGAFHPGSFRTSPPIRLGGDSFFFDNLARRWEIALRPLYNEHARFGGQDGGSVFYTFFLVQDVLMIPGLEDLEVGFTITKKARGAIKPPYINATTIMIFITIPKK